MIRIDRDMALLFLELIIFLKDNEGYTEADVFNYHYRKWRDGRYRGLGSGYELISEAMSRGQSTTVLKDRLHILIDQLQKQSGPTSNRDGDLIDTVFDLLGEPYARCALSGSVIKALKKAIFLPDEYSKISEILAKKERVCVGCSKPLQDREMVMFHSDHGEIGLYCIRCHLPSSAACRKCGLGEECSNGHIPKRVMGMIESAKIDCGEHDRPQVDPNLPRTVVVDTPPTPQGDGTPAARIPTLAEANEILRRTARRTNPLRDVLPRTARFTFDRNGEVQVAPATAPTPPPDDDLFPPPDLDDDE